MTLRRLWPVLLIAAAAALAYGDSLRNGFVWDDHTYIERNPFVQDPRNLGVLLDRRYYLGTHEVLVGHRPVFLASLMADRALWGGRPAGYHATSVLLHTANGVWVYALSAALALPPPAPLWAALFFVLHPVQTEAVDLVSFRADLLAAFFFFAALWLYLGARRARPLPRVLASAALFALALLSKEMAATLPAMALLVEGYFPSPEGRRRRLAVALSAYALVACLYAGFWSPRFHYPGMQPSALRGALDRFAAAMPTAPGPGELKLGLAPGTVFRSQSWEWSALYADRTAWAATRVKTLAGYFRLLAAGGPLAAGRAPLVARSWSEPGVLWSLALLAALASYALWARRRRPDCAFGAAWCLVALIPVMNFLPLYLPMAERYLYLVTAGAAWAAAGALAGLRARAPRAAWGLACLLLAACAARTHARGRDWHDDAALFLGGGPEVPRSSMVHANRGDLLRGLGRDAEAVGEYRSALAARPDYAEAWLGLGAAYAALGQTDASFACHDKAAALAPRSPVVFLAYGLFLMDLRQDARAAQMYQRALALQPELADAWLYLGQTYQRLGRARDARACLDKARALGR